MPDLSPLFSWRGAIARSDLAPNTRLVAVMLSLHMNELGGSAFPSRATLSAETGLDERTVRRHLSALERAGWLRRAGGGVGGRPREDGSPSSMTVRWQATLPEKMGGTVPTITGNGGQNAQKWGTPVAEMGDTGDTQGRQEDVIEDVGQLSLVPPSPKAPRRRTTKTTVPEGFVVTPEMRAWAVDSGITANLDRETPRFIDHFRGTGDRKADWVATWRNWMRRADSFDPRARSGTNGHGKMINLAGSLGAPR